MADIEIFLTGDQIATFGSLSVRGKSNGTQVRIRDAQTLGDETDVFRVVIRDVDPGDTLFAAGQTVDVYAYPDTSPQPEPIYSSLNPEHDAYAGRASSAGHQIFAGSDNLVFDVNGFPDLPDFRYGPGLNPPRAEQLSFETFPTTPPGVPCFVKGTRISTANSARLIETLRVGDLVQTVENGLQPIRWIGSRTVAGMGRFAPVQIDAGALGNIRDLRVSPQHRMLVQDWRTEVYFGTEQAFVAAKHLVNGSTIRQMPCPAVTYFHLAFDAHEVIFAEGAPSESLHLGKTAIASLPHDSRAELIALFPEIDLEMTLTAHACLTAWESRLIA